ncbi:HNH endonuclease family protein [Streptomyces sp. SP18CS02]|uniref:HNH endonuclease family protein n=1 Tax=Streptomyces sp. SP18CS02 TaxID=3002531 RepID=UPI002E7A8FAE|nr:HNH endonuclease family protein [Streptomyces sp. SP18CS02]MEE1754253.1 HNH endonuclease family protein [Streptomyces sp. SP18CS02]
MIKTLKRAATVAALALLPLALATPAHGTGTALPHAAGTTLPLAEAVAALPLAAESREGYVRTGFKHWNAGEIPADGCNTRAEVLLAEATEDPQILPGCKLIGGMWWSYYDQMWVSSASALDIDHMVPLAEAWDSGASQWTAARREAYANDQGASTSLVAVTAASNRSKADQDPAEWLPPAATARCQYLAEWTQTKLRWGLTLDTAERDALTALSTGCPDTTVTYETAP